MSKFLAAGFLVSIPVFIQALLVRLLSQLGLIKGDDFGKDFI